MSLGLFLFLIFDLLNSIVDKCLFFPRTVTVCSRLVARFLLLLATNVAITKFDSFYEFDSRRPFKWMAVSRRAIHICVLHFNGKLSIVKQDWFCLRFANLMNQIKSFRRETISGDSSMWLHFTKILQFEMHFERLTNCQISIIVHHTHFGMRCNQSSSNASWSECQRDVSSQTAHTQCHAFAIYLSPSHLLNLTANVTLSLRVFTITHIFPCSRFQYLLYDGHIQ